MQLDLIRHPAVAVAPGTCYGRSDVALAAPAELAAARLRPLLAGDFMLLSSPLRRCRELADALGEPRLDARLQEINFGAWELQPFDSLGHAALQRWAADPLGHCPPGGESARDMAARVRAVLDEVLALAPERLVLVSHGGPLRVILASVLGLPEQAWLRLEIACGRLCRLQLKNGRARLLGLNV